MGLNNHSSAQNNPPAVKSRPSYAAPRQSLPRLLAILRNSRARIALTLLVLAVAMSAAPNVRAEEGGACLSPGQSEKLTYRYQADTSHHLTVTGRSNPNAQFAIFVTDGAGIIVAEGSTDSGNVQLTWKAQVTEDFTIAVMNNSNATGIINFETD